MRSGDLALRSAVGGGHCRSGRDLHRSTISTIKPKGEKKGRGYAHKHKVLNLVDRDTKQVRSVVVDNLTAAHLTAIIEENIAKEARVMTDEAGQHRKLKETSEGAMATRATAKASTWT